MGLHKEKSMKKTFLLVPLAIILVMSLFLVSCEDEPEIKTYTVSFMDGETTAADPQTVEYGKTATAPTAPTKEGHTFNRWRKVESSSPFDFAKEVITGDTVLEAVWDINTYTVTFKNYDDTEYATKDVFYNFNFDKPVDKLIYNQIYFVRDTLALIAVPTFFMLPIPNLIFPLSTVNFVLLLFISGFKISIFNLLHS